ncbi:MAG: 30S ribosome-binding factor RbfA [Gammaproteobacteria bacterium]
MTKDFSRLDRIGDMLRRELTVLIQHEVNDPRVGMVSVTDVKVSRDLMHAKVYVSVLQPDDKIAAAIDALNHAAGYLRYQLAQRVDLRVMPQLRFYYDDSLVRGNRISNLIDEVTRDKEK